ncbi:Ger(x)C family spore germination protein [Guptibacillus algicola]|uniref:Ger(x)C family spore germination protein n=1 Tax=Guptibacillus algicola TaxID=225844 RepID=UPI001CD3D2D4|nr:Ger(x)C family spore germination protein [Alkalihalobacillus algicola]MCA0987413.1 Ger(x)C family spore germination protein [Alkalihalobacillus algicola]
MKRGTFTILCLLLMLTGCWDSNEIEDVGLIIGVGLDYGKDEEFSMTHQYVVPNNIQGIQGGLSTGQPFQNLTLEGESFFEIIRENSLETDRPPNFTHLKSLVVSDELIEKESVRKLISFFLRDHEFRRTVAVFTTKENVATIMEVEPTKEIFPAVQIKELTQNNYKSLEILENTKFSDISKYISEDASFVIPEIEINKDRIRLSGAAIISNKDFKLVGWLNSKEVQGLKWITNTVKSGLVSLTDESDNNTKDHVVLEIIKANTKIDPTLDKGELKVEVTINTTIRLGEDWNIERDVFEPGWNKKINKDAEAHIKRSVEKVISLAQEEYELDFLTISKWVRIKEPAYYEKHKKNWNSIFKDVPISVNVNVDVDGYGTQDLK